MDYYDILGLSKGASDDEIKKAFKKKAMKFHPDRTGNDKTSEKKFKEAKEAYDVLSDPQKKSMYDQFGTTDFGGGFGGRSQGGFNNHGGFNASGFEDVFEDIFGDIFGGGRARNPNRPYKGADLEYQLELTLEEAAFGIEKVINFRIKNEDKEISISIPAGVDNGDRIRLAGKGEPGINQGPPGDLFIRVILEKHSIFERDGSNLYCNVPISFAEAALGSEIEIPTLSSNKVSIKIPSGTQTGKYFRLKGMGIKSVRGGVVGDLMCSVQIETPVNLSEDQKDLLSQFDSNLKKSKKKHSPKSESWIDGVKNFFK
ncbi:MAG: DnaJ C-terminal domain-containing protein [Gammaproteobacteria bacterium]|jgi:molecular chaperone DnaJ